VGYLDDYFGSVDKVNHRLEVTDGKQVGISPEEGLQMLCRWSSEVSTASGVLFFVGNGASAAMSSHMAADWTKNGRVKALAFNDPAFLTAIGNDIGQDQVFAKPVSWYGSARDMLVAISSSGDSSDIINAIKAARQVGARVVTLSGMKPDNRCRQLGDLNFYIPAHTYGVVEACHQVLLHAWLDCHTGTREWAEE